MPITQFTTDQLLKIREFAEDRGAEYCPHEQPYGKEKIVRSVDLKFPQFGRAYQPVLTFNVETYGYKPAYVADGPFLPYIGRNYNKSHSMRRNDLDKLLADVKPYARASTAREDSMSKTASAMSRLVYGDDHVIEQHYRPSTDERMLCELAETVKGRFNAPDIPDEIAKRVEVITTKVQAAAGVQGMEEMWKAYDKTIPHRNRTALVTV